MEDKTVQNDTNNVLYGEPEAGRTTESTQEHTTEGISQEQAQPASTAAAPDTHPGTGPEHANKDKHDRKKRKCPRFLTDRRLLLFLIDAGCFLASFFLYIVFSPQLVLSQHLGGFFHDAASYWPCALTLLIFAMAGRLLARVYKNVWRYPNIGAYRDMIVSDVVSGILGYAFARLVLFGRVEGSHIGLWPTVSVFAIFAMITLMLRFVYQLLCRPRNFHRSGFSKKKGKITRVGIVGAGQFGVLLADQMISDKQSNLVPCCFFEINAQKIGCLVSGLEVFGEEEVGRRAREMELNEIIIAIPELSPKERNRLCAKYADETGCQVKVHGYAAPQGMIKQLTEEDFNTLLGRPPAY